MKIKINDNFTNIMNFIHANEEVITYHDLLQYCIDYDQYKEYYNNYHIFKDLLLEHNRQIQEQKERRSDELGNIQDLQVNH